MISLPRTLSFRLTAWYVAVLAVALAVLLLALYLTIGAVLDLRVEEDLDEDIEEFRGYFAEGGLDQVIREIDREVVTDDQSQVFFRLLDSQGNELHTSDMSRWSHLRHYRVEPDATDPDGEPVFDTTRTGNNEYAVSMATGVIGPGLVLHLGESREEQEEIMALLTGIFVAAYLLILPIASVVGWMMVRKASRGIRAVTHTAARIHSGSLDERVHTDSSDEEISQLASTFNDMLDRIHDLITEMRQMTDNIAHDLRSPLARIRAIAESALNEADTVDGLRNLASDTIAECDRLLQMINASLDLAEAEAGLINGGGEDVDIAALALDACELFEPVAEEKNITLSCDAGDKTVIRGNLQYLQRLLSNLIDNALKYTPKDGNIRVSVSESGGNVRLVVADTGVGIGSDDQKKIFDRFYRCDVSRQEPGCGMGLSFARAVARAHKGDISVSSARGSGSTFQVLLPKQA